MNSYALKMLFADRIRFLGLVLGIGFAALIITQQMAIFLGLLSFAHGAVDDAPTAKVWVMDPAQESIDISGVRAMNDTALDRVRGVQGVAWAVEHLRTPLECNLGGGLRRACLLIGIDDQSWTGLPPVVEGRVEDLRQDGAVFLDVTGAAKFARAGRDLKIGDSFEINDHRAVVAGFVKSKKAIFFGSYVYTTAARAKSWAPSVRRSLSYILVEPKPGADIPELCARIEKNTGLKAETREDFAVECSNFFIFNTGIAINFGTAVVLGFIVGTAIAGMLFLQFTQDNLKYFGALKAMGASRLTLVKMVMIQAATVGSLGYGLGIGAASIFGLIGVKASRGDLGFLMPPWLLLASASAIFLIVTIAAALSLRSVLMLEAAVVFRN